MAQWREGAKGGETENDSAIILYFILMSIRPYKPLMGEG